MNRILLLFVLVLFIVDGSFAQGEVVGWVDRPDVTGPENVIPGQIGQYTVSYHYQDRSSGTCSVSGVTIRWVVEGVTSQPQICDLSNDCSAIYSLPNIENNEHTVRIRWDQTVDGLSSVNVKAIVSVSGSPSSSCAVTDDGELAVSIVSADEPALTPFYDCIEPYSVQISYSCGDPTCSVQWAYDKQFTNPIVSGVDGFSINPERLSYGEITENRTIWARTYRSDYDIYSDEVSYEILFPDPPEVAIINLKDVYYIHETDFVVLEGSPAGGKFFINGEEKTNFNLDELGVGTHTVFYRLDANPCPGETTRFIEITDNSLCSFELPSNPSGQLVIDKLTGQYIFDKDCYGDVVVDCISTDSDLLSVTGVVSASAVTYDDNWDYVDPEVLPDANVYEAGGKGKWRPKSNYVFNTTYAHDVKNYNDGKFQLEYFNYQNESANNSNKWIESSEVTIYSKNGEALEEINPLGRYSTVHFGYGDAVPVLTAENASYNEVVFESFEDNNVSTDVTAHAGERSRLVTGGGYISPQLKTDQVYIVKFWASKAPEEGNDYSMSGTELPINRPYQTRTVFATPIIQVGEWTLFELTLDTDPLLGYPGIQIQTNLSNIYIDDLRIQPKDSEMTCYVYEPATLRLKTIFDEQHFGLYYQYNAEGKLIRKRIETERGLKTIQETQYNLRGGQSASSGSDGSDDGSGGGSDGGDGGDADNGNGEQ